MKNCHWLIRVGAEIGIEIARPDEHRQYRLARCEACPIGGVARHHRQAGGGEFALDRIAQRVGAVTGDQIEDQILQPWIVAC